MRSRTSALATAAALMLLSPSAARADQEGGLPGRDVVVAANTGFQWGVAPGIFLPSGGGDVGFTLGLHAGYGIEAGPLVLVPGAALQGYFPRSEPVVLMPLAQMKVIFPVGPLAPYVIGGAGPAFVPAADQTYGALQAGGGLIIYFSSRFALGAEVTYLVTPGGPFKALAVGPVLVLGF